MKTVKLITISLLISIGLSAQQKLDKKVVSSGATSSENTTIKLRGSVGQTTIGIASNGTTKAGIGFWESVLASLSTAVVEVDYKDIPTGYYLGQNYPNPADQQTRITVEIPKRVPVSLRLYSVQGQYLGVIHEQVMSPGRYLLSAEVAHLPEGQYIYVMLIEGKIIKKNPMSIVHAR